MKWIVVFLLPLAAFAESRQDQYLKQCQGAFEFIIAKRQPDKLNEARQLGRDSCPDMAKTMAANGDVKMNACMDVIYMLSDGAPLADRKQMAAVYCF